MATGLTRRRFIGLSGSVALSIGGIGSFLAAGCGDGSSSEAESKGKVVVLSWGDPQLASLLGEAFKKETGIDLVMVPGEGDNDFYNKISLGGPGTYDCVHTNVGFVQKYVKSGLIEQLDVRNFPNSAQLYPQFLTDPRWKPYYLIDAPNKVWCMPHQWGSYGMTYLTNLNLTNPISWEEMWQVPKGKVLLQNDPIAGIGMTARLVGVPWKEVWSTTGPDLDKAVEKLKALKPFQLGSSNEQQINAYRTGNAVIGVTYSLGFAHLVNNAVGKTIAASIVPAEGMFGALDGVLLLKGAKNRANALKYINFQAGAVSQKIYWDRYQGPTANRVATAEILHRGGDEEKLLLALRGNDPEFAASMVQLQDPENPKTWTDAWNQVIA
jgi:spermidine/putrescine transport system substrate-binding protein